MKLFQFFYDFEEGDDEEGGPQVQGAILTELGEFMQTESGDFLIQE